MFEESDMEGVEYSTGRHVPQAIGLGVRGIPNKNAWARALIDFGVMSLDKCKGSATDFTKVR